MKDYTHTFVILAYKESLYLEDAIISIINQSVKTNVVIATSTPNNYITNLAKKYNINILINNKSNGIASDFNYALNCVDTDLVTIAHQDDTYEEDYVKYIYIYANKYRKALILFTSYYEIHNNKKVYTSKNIKIKKTLLFFLKIKALSKCRFAKRFALRFGNSICCPAVTYNKNNIKIKNIFENMFLSNMDWFAWEKLSKEKGNFIYINKPLMGHRIHEESTTSKLIKEGKRTNEDLEVFKKFWPLPIAKSINKVYLSNEKGNKE